MSQDFGGSNDVPFDDSSAQSDGQLQSLMNSLLTPNANGYQISGYTGALWSPMGGNGAFAMPFGPYQPPFPTFGNQLDANMVDESLEEDIPQSTQSANSFHMQDKGALAPFHERLGVNASGLENANEPSSHSATSNAVKTEQEDESTVQSQTRIENQKRAAELRAKLMAGRSSSTIATNGIVGASPTRNFSSGGTASEAANVGKFAPDTSRNSSSLKLGDGTQAVDLPSDKESERGISMDIDNLITEAKVLQENQTLKIKPPRENEAPSHGGTEQMQHDLVIRRDLTSSAKAKRPAQEDGTSSEEGEILDESTQPTSVDRADQPAKSVETSQDTTTESHEKMIRQTETKLAYQNLKKQADKRRRETHTVSNGKQQGKRLSHESRFEDN